MDTLNSILKLTEEELNAVVQNGRYRSREEIDSVYKLIDIVKDIYCIWDCEDGGESYDDGMSYRYGNSYRRKRDSMGRFSRRAYRYSRDDGKEEYKEHLREMMDDAPDEMTRQSLQRMISQMS